MSIQTLRKVLVAGGYGVSGTAVVEAALADRGWDVITAGRRPAPTTLLSGHAPPSHVIADLLDAEGTVHAFSHLSDVTDVAFCAYLERPTMAETVAPNVAMLVNTLNALTSAGAKIGRVVLMGGGKSYGGHLGPYKTPAKESDPRLMAPLFYEAQEDALRDWAARNGANWTILRPDGIIGPSLGSPMNLLTGLATYAAVSKALKIPLRFAGSAAGWSTLLQVTDADLLGRATLWALEAATARDEIFNLTNGDHFRWKHIWNDLGAFFDIPVAEPQPMSLTTQMADKGPLWDKIVAEHGLRATSWKDIASWGFVDALMNVNFDLVQSTIKIRQAGFAECIDTHVSVIGHLQRMRAARLIP
jgi:nucleoside-diphosphate-sugar epimerase